MKKNTVTIGIALSPSANFIEIGRKSAALAQIASVLEEKGKLPEEMDFTQRDAVSHTCETTFSALEVEGLMNSIPSLYHHESFIRWE